MPNPPQPADRNWQLADRTCGHCGRLHPTPADAWACPCLPATLTPLRPPTRPYGVTRGLDPTTTPRLRFPHPQPAPHTPPHHPTPAHTRRQPARMVTRRTAWTGRPVPTRSAPPAARHLLPALLLPTIPAAALLLPSPAATGYAIGVALALAARYGHP